LVKRFFANSFSDILTRTSPILSPSSSSLYYFQERFMDASDLFVSIVAPTSLRMMCLSPEGMITSSRFELPTKLTFEMNTLRLRSLETKQNVETIISRDQKISLPLLTIFHFFFKKILSQNPTTQKIVPSPHPKLKLKHHLLENFCFILE